MPKEKKKLTKNEATKSKSDQGRRKRRDVKREPEKKKLDVDAWKPKSSMGRKVKSGEIKDIDEILDKGQKILESEIVDILLPELNTDLLLIGQSKGKFGGGQKRVFNYVLLYRLVRLLPYDG